jgi:hypothetical protein
MTLIQFFSNTTQVIMMIISFFIIFFSIQSAYYGVRYFCTPYSKLSNYRWLYIMVTGVSIMWALVFSYISIMTGLGKPPLAPDEFGALFIRPTILITVVVMSICQRLRYIEANHGEIPKCQLHKT